MRPTPDDYNQARTLLAEHGNLRPQLNSDWRGTIPLPSDIATYFQQIGPVDVYVRGYGNSTELPSLARLWDYQAGYRWNGITGNAVIGWDDNWIVVGSEGGDPYIFDVESGTVLFARHGEGTWRPRKCYPNLPLMVSCLSTLSAIRRAAGKDFVDEDCFVQPKYREAAIAAITKIAGSAAAAKRVVSRAGWGEPGAA
jgi:hypothetical protein